MSQSVFTTLSPTALPYELTMVSSSVGSISLKDKGIEFRLKIRTFLIFKSQPVKHDCEL